MTNDLYFAPLNPGIPETGAGLYECGTGRLVYYSDGRNWFFETGTGKPVLYVKDGHLFWADGTPAPASWAVPNDPDLFPDNFEAQRARVLADPRLR